MICDIWQSTYYIRRSIGINYIFSAKKNSSYPYLYNICIFIHYWIGHAISGLYGNDDFHNGMEQALTSGRQIEQLVFNFTRKVSEPNRTMIDEMQKGVSNLYSPKWKKKKRERELIKSD